MEDICTACLSRGRKLHFIGETDFYLLYAQILNEISVYDLSQVCIKVCWECRATLYRFHTFKLLVKSSYTALLHQLLPTKPPRLDCHRVCITSYPDIKAEFDDSDPPDVYTDADDVYTQTDVDTHADDVGTHGDDVGTHDVDLEFNMGVKNEVDCEVETHCEPQTFVNDLAVGKSGKKRRREVKKEKVKVTKDKKKPKPKAKVKKKSKSIKSNLVDSKDFSVVSVRGGVKAISVKKTEKEDLDCKEAAGQEMDRLEPAVPPASEVKSRARPAEQLAERPECVECGKVFSSRKTYRYHLNVLHKGQNRYPCPRCGKVYQWKSNLGRHLRSHKARDSGELYCSLCDKRFASVATYRQHLRVSRQHVSESEFSFMCNECGKKFVSKTRLRDHIDWEHLKKIKFVCQLCTKPFKCHTSLYVHLQNVHRDKEKRDNLCHVCGKSYQNAAKLKYHIVAMHTHETPYRCAQCDAAFGWYSSLYRHVREVHYKMKLQPNKKGKKGKKADVIASLMPPPLLPPHLGPPV